MVAPHKIASSNSSWNKFLLVDKKISLAVLTARLSPLGHEPGFGGFFCGRMKPCCFFLMKNSRIRSPPAIFFFDYSFVHMHATFVVVRSISGPAEPGQRNTTRRATAPRAVRARLCVRLLARVHA